MRVVLALLLVSNPAKVPCPSRRGQVEEVGTNTFLDSSGGDEVAKPAPQCLGQGLWRRESRLPFASTWTSC